MTVRVIVTQSAIGSAFEKARELTATGLKQGEDLHALQTAFWDDHGLQCGYCTPGMVMSATELVTRNPKPTEGEVRHWLEGNLCRCTGYHNIVKAVITAAETMRGGAQ